MLRRLLFFIDVKETSLNNHLCIGNSLQKLPLESHGVWNERNEDNDIFVEEPLVMKANYNFAFK